ncbi:MAG: ABC transporter ATP-binding protein [Chloroflexi bacterium]|nr:ABC transporter ATP-binding protein [Chloroflexota bacterium]
MSQTAIRVIQLGKNYRIGARQNKADTLRDLITQSARAPFRRAKGVLSGEAYGAADLHTTFLALHDVSFEVPFGEVVGIIGHNGAGKSTLLKILSRITEPSEGFAEIYGRVGALLEVGTGFNPELTGRENIYLNAAILGMKRAEISRKFDEIVAFAEVEQFIDTPVKHYSSGMALRLGFAVAAHLEPEILIVDEVLAVGDLAFQKKCLGKMQDVSMTGRTVLFVSHNMPAVTSLCSRAIWLQKGNLIADGPSIEIVGQYTQKTLATASVKYWDNLENSPGQDGFKLIAVSLVNEHAQPTSVINVECPYYLNIVYHVARPDLTFRISAIFNSQGSTAFTSIQPNETIHPQSGFYTTTLEIPNNLFSESTYSLDISVFASRGKKQHYCREKEVVAFQVYDQMLGTSARGDYVEGMLGLVRPLLHWQPPQPSASPSFLK